MTENGEWFLMGKNDSYDLGLGHSNNVFIPTKIKSPNGNSIIDIAFGSNHTLMLTSNNFCFGAGISGNGEFGMSKSKEYTTFVEIIDNVVAIASTGAFSLYLKKSGECFGSGENHNGQLGADVKYAKNPVKIPILDKIISICCVAANSGGSLFLTEKGEMFGCGYNVNAELGVGSRTPVSVLTKLYFPNGIKIKEFCGIGKRMLWIYFKILLIGNKKNSKCIWKRVPIEIIKEICKFI